MTHIILSRHGNTFGPQDPVVWTGATNDLPLVKKGFEQAESLAAALVAREIKPVAIYCGPLQRTFAYASVLIQKLNLPIQQNVDKRLNEIDYGEWTGLTNAQVSARFGEASLKAWDEHSVWSRQGGWGSSESAVVEEVHAFVKDLIQRYSQNETVVVVTSNGRLRYFLTLVAGEFEKRASEGSFKVKTGNICKLLYENGEFSIPAWDIEPKSF